MMTAPSKMRIGGSKVKTGCITCKARRVKCDEGRPACSRCIRGNRECGGYPEPKPRNEQSEGKLVFVHYAVDISTSIRPDTEAAYDERRAVDFFQHRTAKELAAPFTSQLWTEALLRAANQEVAIKCALVSLAGMHEAFRNLNSRDSYNKGVHFARQYYGRSIREVMNLNERQSENALNVTLLTCLLFSAIETLQAHYHSSMSHAKYGMRILSEIDCMSKPERLRLQELAGVPMDLIKPYFINIGTQIIAISGSSRDGMEWLNTQVHDLPHGATFSTVEEAALDILLLTKDLCLLAEIAESSWNDADYPSTSLRKYEQKLRQRFENWTAGFELMCARKQYSTLPPTSESDSAISILRVHQSVDRVLLNTIFEMNQTCFDLYLVDFERIVIYSENLLRGRRASGVTSGHKSTDEPFFSLQLGVLPSLWVVTARCRDPSIRHRALDLMKSCRRREGVWDSELVSQAAEKFVELEERAAARYWQSRKQQSNLDTYNPTQNLPHADLKSVRDFPECCRFKRLNSNWCSDTSVDVQYVGSSGYAEQSAVFSWEE